MKAILYTDGGCMAALSDFSGDILDTDKTGHYAPKPRCECPPLARNTLETRPSENRCVCEVNMLPVSKSFPYSLHIQDLCGIEKYLCLTLLLLTTLGPLSFAQSVPPPPQGAQTDASFADSFRLNRVTNVFATTQKISCYTPEVPYAGNLGPTNGYTGETPCSGNANTGEDLGPYATQNVVNQPFLVNNHSESDLRVDPTNPNHLIGQTKSFDGGRTWSVQGHVPGYEGFTDNTDPVGAFDGFGNYHALLLPYQFSYDKSGFQVFNN